MVLTLGHLVVDIYGGFLVPLIPVLRDRLDVKLSSLTALAGLCGIAVNGIQPLAGMLSPRFSRPVLLIAAPVLAAMLALIGVPGELLVLGALAVVGHLGIGIFHPDGMMAAHAISGSREHLGVPIFLSGGFLGWSLGILLATQWVHRFSFDGFWILALPGLLMPLLFVMTGLCRKGVAHAVGETGGSAGDGPAFGMLLLLGIVMVSVVMVLYTFLNVDLEARLGQGEGIKWGGYCLSLLGISGVLGSLVWGYLSGRVSPFALMAIGQLACAPLYVLLVRAPSGPALVATSIPVGFFMGGAFFPILATVARRSRGFTPSVRAGLIVGGSWGCGSLVAMACGYLTDWGVTAGEILMFPVPLILASSALAFVMYLRERKRASAGPEKHRRRDV